MTQYQQPGHGVPAGPGVAVPPMGATVPGASLDPRIAPQHIGAPMPGAPVAPPAAQPPPGRPKDILTLPPLEVLRNEAPPSKRTGEPVRPPQVLIALVLFMIATAAVAGTYAHHWWQAAHPPSYGTSARLIEWLKPPPGKWLALTLEGVLAAVAALVAGACGVAGFQAWNGWRWSRWAGVVAVALTGVLVALFSWWGLIALGLAALGAVLLFLPPMTLFFGRFESHRAGRRAPYRRPERILYGRLPRFR